ncbi:MAG TPA: zf-TFIIB domain-containing protein [Acidimicrobiales bacterium]
MKCPRDPDVTLLMSTREGIEIDYCPVCRGVWLDRGELDKIIERSNRDDWYRDDDRRRYDEHVERPAPYEHKGYKKKRKNFLSELFELD